MNINGSESEGDTHQTYILQEKADNWQPAQHVHNFSFNCLNSKLGNPPFLLKSFFGKVFFFNKIAYIGFKANLNFLKFARHCDGKLSYTLPEWVLSTTLTEWMLYASGLTALPTTLVSLFWNWATTLKPSPVSTTLTPITVFVSCLCL